MFSHGPLTDIHSGNEMVPLHGILCLVIHNRISDKISLTESLLSYTEPDRASGYDYMMLTNKVLT